jgi:dCMP deaminase
MDRPTWQQYFLKIAEAVSLRADCSRRKVGALVVRDHRIVSSGYNGSAPGAASCLAGACPRSTSDVEPGSSYDTGPGSCIAIHAEANAIIYAGIDGCKGSIMYLTDKPCDGCWKLIKASGISAVIWPGKLWYTHEAQPRSADWRSQWL